MTDNPHLFVPRDYQTDALTAAVEAYERGVNRQLIRMATGLGKTSGVAMHIPLRFPKLAKKGMLFVAHRQEILLDTYDKFRKAYPYKDCGLEMGDSTCIGFEDFIFASVDSVGRLMSNRLQERYHRREFGIIVTDEGHHVTPDSVWDNVLTYFGVGSNPDHRFDLKDGTKPLSIFLTATPNRHDGQGLYPVVDQIVADYDYAYGVRNGWLVDIVQMWAREMQGVTGVETVEDEDADFIIRLLRDHGLNHSTLIFARSVGQSKIIAATLNDSDIALSARHVDGETDRDLRKQYLTEFRDGEVKVMSNYGVFREGVDIKGITMIVDNAPTASIPLACQKIGRGSRPHAEAKVDSWKTASERIAAIKISPKPYLTYVPCFPPTAQPFGIIASLLGRDDLDQGLADGKMLIEEVLDRVEEIEAEQPERPINEITSLDDLQVEIREVDFWNQNIYSADVQSLTTLQWVFEGNNAALFIPENPFAKSGYEKCAVVVRFEEVADGSCKKTLIEVGGWNQSLGKPRGKRVLDKGTSPTVAEAVAQLDRWLKANHDPIVNKLTRGASGPVLPKQIKTLKRHGIRYNPDTTTEGTADLLIAKHLIDYNLSKTKDL